MSWGKRIAVLTAFIAFVLAAIGLISFIKFSHNTKSEYVTAAAIRSTTAFVKSNNGRWPRTWAELKAGDDTEKFVLFDFELTSEKVLSHPELLDQAIQPLTKRWVVYPHHKRDLEELLEALKSAQVIEKNSAVPIQP